MPIKGGRRTDKEALFIGHLASTGDAGFAAMKAGYKDPQVQGWQKAHNPAIAEAVRKAQVARLSGDLLPKALDLLEAVLMSPKETTRNRLTAAQIVVKHSLGAAGEGEGKEPHEMTTAELQARIDTLRQAMADKARPVIEGQAIGGQGDVFG